MKTLFSVSAGYTQARLKISNDINSNLYYFCSTDLLRDALYDIPFEEDLSKINQIRSEENLETIDEGDLIVSLVGGFAAIASEDLTNESFILTQNFAKITPSKEIDKKYLLFLLNEDRNIRSQLFGNIVGIGRTKITVKQLSELTIDKLPPLDKQKLIGDVYIKTKRLTYLRKQSLELKEKYTIEALKASLRQRK